MNTLKISEVQAIQVALETIDSEISGLQSITYLIELGGKLSSWIAFTGEQLSIAKKIWREETAKAYDNYVFSKAAHGIPITPTMANKYAEAKSGKWEGDYQFIERVNKSATHILDFLRTAISALKAEQAAANYQIS